jgi:hypothetical protein
MLDRRRQMSDFLRRLTGVVCLNGFPSEIPFHWLLKSMFALHHVHLLEKKKGGELSSLIVGGHSLVYGSRTFGGIGDQA